MVNLKLKNSKGVVKILFCIDLSKSNLAQQFRNCRISKLISGFAFNPVVGLLHFGKLAICLGDKLFQPPDSDVHLLFDGIRHKRG